MPALLPHEGRRFVAAATKGSSDPLTPRHRSPLGPFPARRGESKFLAIAIVATSRRCFVFIDRQAAEVTSFTQRTDRFP